MKKTTVIILCLSVAICLVLTGFTGYYIGTKNSKPDSTKVATNPLEEANNDETQTTDSIVDVEAIKESLREEVREEVKAEVYDDIYEQVMTDVEANLQARIDELLEEQRKADEEAAAKAEEEASDKAAKEEASNKNNTSNNNSNNNSNKNNENNNNGGGGTTQKPPKTEPYINVHDITCSMSDIQSAIYGAVDSSSGTVMCDLSTITGYGTFTIYWTSTDGATATSKVTITE